MSCLFLAIRGKQRSVVIVNNVVLSFLAVRGKQRSVVIANNVVLSLLLCLC